MHSRCIIQIFYHKAVMNFSSSAFAEKNLTVLLSLSVKFNTCPFFSEVDVIHGICILR